MLTQFSTVRRKIGEDYSHNHSDWQSASWMPITSRQNLFCCGCTPGNERQQCNC